MSEHPPTPEQSAVLDATRAGGESLMIQAFAGCAKTTTLEMAAPLVKAPALALAFNKKIAMEMQRRFPGNFSVKTMNGLGHGAWARANPSATIELDDKKLGRLVTTTAKDFGLELSSDLWDSARMLVSRAMTMGIVPEGSGPEGLLPDDRAAWLDGPADDLGLAEDDFDLLWELSREILRRDIAEARKGRISFDDQVYCSSLLGGQFPRFPVVFVDESQDLNPLNHRMLELCMRSDGRLVSVGDVRQAIYRFRGADADSMSKIRRLRSNWVDLPLATTFRCPKRIVARQQAHAPGFTAFHTNAEGRVARLADGLDEDKPTWTWEHLTRWLMHPQDQVAVLCRNNGPLMSLAFRLLRRGVGVVMLGRDIGKGLAVLSRKLCPDDSTPRDLILGAIDEWEATESSKARVANREEKIAGISDRAECLRAVLSGAECRDAGELRTMLTRLFERESGQVTLSSIHRAKGMEWDLVLHLDPWRIPSKWARKSGDERQLTQEYNLKYVCETRTRHTLIEANLEDFRY